MVWAIDRNLPNKEYLEFEDHPETIKGYTPNLIHLSRYKNLNSKDTILVKNGYLTQIIKDINNENTGEK